MTTVLHQKPSRIAQFFDPAQLHILQNVSWFLTILGAGFLLHFVTDAADVRHFPPLFVFILRAVEYILFVGDAIVFVIAIVVGFVLQTRKILLLVGFDIFSIWAFWNNWKKGASGNS